MPIYTYRCENCGVQFERTQKFTETPLKRCPECNKKSLRKVYTPVGIVFKGSGFYATDNRSPSGTRSNADHADHKDHSEKKTPEGETSTPAEEKPSVSKEKSSTSTEKSSKPKD